LFCLKKNQQVTTIPIDQIKTRTPEIEKLIKLYHKQPPKKNIDEGRQAGGAVASAGSSSSSSSISASAKLAQLQKEHEEALQKLAVLSKQSNEKDDQLKKKDSVIAALEVQRVALIALPVLMVAFWWFKPK
jgi:hypothetical protein